MTQLDLIEPTGAELPRLAAFHARRAEQLFAQADIWELRGSPRLVETLEYQASYAFDQAAHCLIAFEFECLGGLQ